MALDITIDYIYPYPGLRTELFQSKLLQSVYVELFNTFPLYCRRLCHQGRRSEKSYLPVLILYSTS